MPEFQYASAEGVDHITDPAGNAGISVARQGGELISYRVPRPDGKALGLLYRDGDASPNPDGWSNHATVLFPIVGGLKNRRSVYRGDTLISSRGNHGFARHSRFGLTRHRTEPDGGMLQYSLLPNEEIRAEYPFDFELELQYRLQDSVLTVTFGIHNHEKEKALPYCFGWHPGFRAPMLAGRGSRQDCQVLFGKGTYRHYAVNEHCRLTGKVRERQMDGPWPRTEKELADTILIEVSEKVNRNVTFHDPHSKIRVQVDFPDFPHLGLWAKEGGNFICVEPWQGMDDHENQEAFEEKVGVVELEPGAEDRRTITVTPSFTG